MVRVNCFVAVAGVVAESRTCTVKVAAPLAVGVPEITPVEAFRVSPVGSVPTVIDHEYGVTPPVACKVVL
jgi:hypothetical protein